jgi:AcrR family transcriptional regulator
MPRHKQISDEQLITVARRVFLKAGVNAPVSLVAKALGVTSAALFHRAGTRERLVISAMTLTDPREFTLLKRIRGGPDPAAALEPQLQALLLELSAHLAKITPCLLFLHAAGIGSRERRALPGSTRRHLAGWLRRAQRLRHLELSSPAVVADALVGALEARQLYRYVHGDPLSASLERRYVKAMVAELVFRRASVARAMSGVSANMRHDDGNGIRKIDGSPT